jgi:PKD domain
MNMKLNLMKKISLALASFVMVFALAIGTTSALPYTGPTTAPSPVPAFNVFTGSNLPAPMPADGEQDFFQGRVPVGGNLNEGTTPFTDPVNSACTNGEVIQLHVYVHNGASQYENNNGSGPSVIHGAKVKVALPGASDKSTKFSPTATLSADNASSVTDSATINCSGQPVQLQYIAGSASQYSTGTGVVPLSDSIVSSGASIRSEQVPGDVWGCWNERVYVVIAVKVIVPKPPVVIPPTCNLITLDSDNKTVKVKDVSYTAGDSKINKLLIDFGDGTIANINPNQLPTSHTYTNYGTYNIRATLDTSTGKVTSDLCAAKVTLSNKPVTPVTPLPNTGPGDVIGIFAIVTVMGAIAHRIFTKRATAKS